MSKTLLTVATRKGAFILESDDRRDWTLRGPYCEGWPVYHAIYDPTTGDIYAAAASEWHGSSVWRSPDLGETWEMSSEGLSYGDEDGRKISKVSTLARAGDRLLVGVEAPGIFESRDNGKTWSLLSTLSGQHGSEALGRPGEPASRPPRNLGLRHRPRRLRQLLRDRAGSRRVRDRGRRLVVDAAQQRPAPRLAAPTTRTSASACTSSSARSDPQRMYQQNHVGMHRSRRRRQVVDRDHRRTAGRLRLRGGRPSPRHRDVLRRPGRRRPRPDDARGQGHGLAHARCRLELAADAQRPAAGERPPRRPAPGDDDGHARVTPGVYFGSSTGQVFASADEGDTWSEIASYLPSISSVDVGRARLTWRTSGSQGR